MSDMLRLLAAEVTEASGLVPSENINKMWSTVVTGLVVVFLILILLVIILWALGKVMNIQRKPKIVRKTEPVSAAALVPIPVPVADDDTAEEEYEEDDGEIIAVIAAAIAAYGEAEGKQYKIASVKRKEKSARSSWGAAGVAENTRPF